MIKGVSIANLGRGGEGVATHGWEGWAPGVHEGHGNMTGARQRNENDMKGHELGTTIMRDDHGREHRDWDEEERAGWRQRQGARSWDNGSCKNAHACVMRNNMHIHIPSDIRCTPAHVHRVSMCQRQ